MTSPRIVAHRGWPSRMPENTLPSLVAAIERGAHALEVDVQLTRDAVPVLFHDRDLLRCTGEPGTVAEFDLASLARLSAGVPGQFGDRFPDARVPTLAATVELLAGHPDVHLFAEIKRVSLERFGLDAVLSAVSPILDALRERCTLISFDRALVAELLRAGRHGCGWIMDGWSDSTLAAAREITPHYVFADVKMLPKNDEPLPDAPWRWAVYVVDDAALARHWAERGASFVETDDIGRLLDSPPNPGRRHE